jgi:hypothetical protein
MVVAGTETLQNTLAITCRMLESWSGARGRRRPLAHVRAPNRATCGIPEVARPLPQCISRGAPSSMALPVDAAIDSLVRLLFRDDAHLSVNRSAAAVWVRGRRPRAAPTGKGQGHAEGGARRPVADLAGNPSGRYRGPDRARRRAVASRQSGVGQRSGQSVCRTAAHRVKSTIP